MAAGNFDQARHNMVVQQVRPWDVVDYRVLDTISRIPRDAYIAPEYKNLAYADTSIPLNDTESMMHPIVEGRLLQALDIQPDDNILEIGTGSGYLSACLAQLGHQVDSYEIDEQLANQAQATLQQQHIYNVNVIAADAVSHFTSRKTYDVIAITGSLTELPDTYKQILKQGGRLFVITGEDPLMQAHLITRTGQDSWTDQVLFETSISALQQAEKKPVFHF